MSPSHDSHPYLRRHLEGVLAEALADTPVVCILGPWQCGKSTLAIHAAPNRAYVSLDDPNSYELARTDPKGFIGELPEYVTIDEVQRVPELTLAIKQSVDANRKPGRFLLTGSADLLQLPRLSDSLAGRMEWIELQPFSEAEKEGSEGLFLEQWLDGKLNTGIWETAPPRASTLPGRVIAGGYPEAFRRKPARTRQWQEQSIRSIIERDIHDISQVKDGEEVKAAASVDSSDAQGLRRLAKQAGKDFQGGILLYDGASILPLDRTLKLYAVPLVKLWEL